jgi:GxxExxY protein
LKLDRLTESTICCAYNVSNKLGAGFVEKVYENALAIELRKAGFDVNQQSPIKIMYDGFVVGEFAADLLVESKVILELKSVKFLDAIHSAQCLNYLKATGLPVCLLINFGKPKAQVKRIVHNF